MPHPVTYVTTFPAFHERCTYVQCRKLGNSHSRQVLTSGFAQVFILLVLFFSRHIVNLDKSLGTMTTSNQPTACLPDCISFTGTKRLYLIQLTVRQTGHIHDVSADISGITMTTCQFIFLFLHVKWLQDGLLICRVGFKSKYVQIILNSARCHSFVSSSSISLFYSSAALLLLTRFVLWPSIIQIRHALFFTSGHRAVTCEISYQFWC